jgi:hypothetical protein
MKITKFLIVFFIFTIIFTEVPMAIPISVSYKQGIYNVSEYHGINATAKLMTPNNTTSLIIVDANSNERFYRRFDTVDEVITLGFIKDGDQIVIAGTGEISVTFNK